MYTRIQSVFNVLKYIPRKEKYLIYGFLRNLNQLNTFDIELIQIYCCWYYFHLKTYVKYKTYEEMELNVNILRGIYAYGFDKPSYIQQCATILIIQRNDIIIQSQHTIRKIASYSIPLLQILNDYNQCQILILTSTPQIAIDCCKSFEKIGQFINDLSIVTCIGDDEIKINKGVQVIIGTPQIIQNMIQKQLVNIKSLKIIIFDEFDELISRGFKQTIHPILNCIESPLNTQKIVFSKTATSNELNEFKKNEMIRALEIKSNDKDDDVPPPLHKYCITLNDVRNWKPFELDQIQMDMLNQFRRLSQSNT